jgi:hypothetical protein
MKLCVVKPQAATTAAPTASRPTAASATFMAGCERAKEREREKEGRKRQRERQMRLTHVEIFLNLFYCEIIFLRHAVVGVGRVGRGCGRCFVPAQQPRVRNGRPDGAGDAGRAP